MRTQEDKRPSVVEASPGATCGVEKPYPINSLSDEPKKVKRLDGKPVGIATGGTFTKYVDSKKHMLQKPPAWCCDLSTLLEVKQYGVNLIQLIDRERGITWKAPVDAFFGKGSFEINRGHGRQRVLPLKKWTVSGDGIPEQLSFFEGMWRQ